MQQSEQIREKELKDVILLCKGYYDRGKYGSVLEALKEYYRKNYADDMEEVLCESFLLHTVLENVMDTLIAEYGDGGRLSGFLYGMFRSSDIQTGTGNKTDIDTWLFYYVVQHLSAIQMRGHNLKDIDTSGYFTKENGHRRFTGEII